MHFLSIQNIVQKSFLDMCVLKITTRKKRNNINKIKSFLLYYSSNCFTEAQSVSVIIKQLSQKLFLICQPVEAFLSFKLEALPTFLLTLRSFSFHSRDLYQRDELNTALPLQRRVFNESALMNYLPLQVSKMFFWNVWLTFNELRYLTYIPNLNICNGKIEYLGRYYV